MFKAELKNRMKEIFGFSKVTYDQPSEETPEQDVLFIAIEDAPCKIVDSFQIAKVTGILTVFSQNEKLPFGFFIKKISTADKSLTKDLHFSEIDRNAETFGNLVARRMNFTFLYKADYNPDQGLITSIEIEED